jgi:hypothetical protein
MTEMKEVPSIPMPLLFYVIPIHAMWHPYDYINRYIHRRPTELIE